MGVLGLTKRVLGKVLLKKSVNWKEIEYFNSDWKNRIVIMSQFINSGDSILDLGCGEMWLKEFLPEKCLYIPVDYTARKGGDTVICDFNKGEFPELKVKVAFISGCFEYIIDYNAFVKNLSTYCDRVIISYVSKEIQPDLNKRIGYAWKNHLTRSQFLKVFVRNGFTLEKSVTDGKFFIYHFLRHS